MCCRLTTQMYLLNRQILRMAGCLESKYHNPKNHRTQSIKRPEPSKFGVWNERTLCGTETFAASARSGARPTGFSVQTEAEQQFQRQQR
jgi:hypothetical protein